LNRSDTISIFVTGGTGLVGSHLLLSLLQKGYRVRALRRSSSDLDQVRRTFAWYVEDYEVLLDNIEWVEGDLQDIYSIEPLLKGIAMIYHCAAMVSFSRESRKEMIETNVTGTANLVNAALSMGVSGICHVSSVSALGKSSGGELVTEETGWVPSRKNSGYSLSKFFSETEIWRGVAEGLDAVVVNPSIIVGPGNWKSGSPSFFRMIHRGMPFYTTGTTGYVDVRDVADVMILLTEPVNFATAKGNRFLLSSENLTFHDFFTRIALSLNRPAPVVKATRHILSAVWRLLAVVSLVTGKPAKITRETTASASGTTLFDGSKIETAFSFRYRKVQEAIDHTALIFLKEQSGS
jgi:dihydroflavonol-4-reductase